MSGTTSAALAKKTRVDQYLDLLRESRIPDPLFFRPAKAMTKAEARDCNLDARNVVFLTRLATLMKWYGATTIYHIGFLFDAERNDCRGQGGPAISPGRPAMAARSLSPSTGPASRS
jgi:hypothetical protein